MRPILRRDRVAALAGPRVFFAEHIEVLEPDHPERRFVSALGLYSHAVDRGRVPSGYVQADAERFAQALVMPAEDLDASARRTDAELAERFAAPLDQVPLRRRERAGASAKMTASARRVNARGLMNGADALLGGAMATVSSERAEVRCGLSVLRGRQAIVFGPTPPHECGVTGDATSGLEVDGADANASGLTSDPG